MAEFALVKNNWRLVLGSLSRPCLHLKGTAACCKYWALDAIVVSVGDRQYCANSTEAYDLLYALAVSGSAPFSCCPRAYPREGIQNWMQALSNAQVEYLLANITRTGPLQQHDGKDDFRISIAGAQEKTALFWHQKMAAPTWHHTAAHVFKCPLDLVVNLGNLSNAVENEGYGTRRHYTNTNIGKSRLNSTFSGC